MSTYENLGVSLTSSGGLPAQENSTTGAMQQAAAYGVYAAVADITKYLLIGGVIVIATTVFPWKKIYSEVTK